MTNGEKKTTDSSIFVLLWIFFSEFWDKNLASWQAAMIVIREPPMHQFSRTITTPTMTASLNQVGPAWVHLNPTRVISQWMISIKIYIISADKVNRALHNLWRVACPTPTFLFPSLGRHMSQHNLWQSNYPKQGNQRDQENDTYEEATYCSQCLHEEKGPSKRGQLKGRLIP